MLRLNRTTQVLCLVTLASAGCSHLLDVKTPDIVRPTSLTSAAGLATLRAGAFGDFAKAYSGDATASDGQETQILASGMLGDEFMNTDTDPERIAYDARHADPSGNGGHLPNFYAVLHRAREAAEATATAYATTNPTPSNADQVISEMNSLAGYVYIWFAEDYCNGVPISTVDAAGNVTYGMPLTGAQLLQIAVQRFDTALAHAQKARVANLQQLASVGLGRALLDLGQPAQAATAVGGVPTTFKYAMAYSTNTPRQENAVFFEVNLLQRWSFANKKGINGIAYRDVFAAGDPRTPWQPAPGAGFGFDKTAGPQYMQELFPNLSAPIPLATGVEARLIEAEAALAAGNTASFQQIHNALRATLNTPKVGPVSTDTMTAASMLNFQFQERALWMYSTGHRLGDMRRLIRQYGRNSETVFPTGPYYRTLYPSFGTDVNFVVSFTETNNPNFKGCVDRNP